jgi:hypothetical protein
MALAAAWAFRHLGMTAQELLQDGIRRFVPFKVAAKGTEPSADYSPTLKSAFILTILLGFLFVPHAHADLTTGLVGYWSFDDGTGTQAADFPGRGTPLYGSTRLRGR